MIGNVKFVVVFKYSHYIIFSIAKVNPISNEDLNFASIITDCTEEVIWEGNVFINIFYFIPITAQTYPLLSADRATSKNALRITFQDTIIIFKMFSLD